MSGRGRRGHSRRVIPAVPERPAVPMRDEHVVGSTTASMNQPPCHALIPGPTRMTDPNRVRDARPNTGTLNLIFFFKSQLALVGMAHTL